MEDNGKGWEIVSRQCLLKTPVFDIYEEKSTCPRNGKVSNFNIIDCANSWVTVIALTKSDELIVIRQYRHGSRQFEFEVPGGCMDEGEDPLAAGIRELREETGYAGEKARIIGKVRPNPALQGNWCYTVFIEGVEKTEDIDMDDGEDIFTIKIPCNRIEDMIRCGDITHGLMLNAILFYKLLREKAVKKGFRE